MKSAASEGSREYTFGNEVLGPIVASYLWKLDAYIRSFNVDSHKVLFVARAGLRIRKLYLEYLTKIDRSVPINIDVLWASRLMIAKALWKKRPDISCQILEAEFKNASLLDLIKGIYGVTNREFDVEPKGEISSPNTAANFSKFIWTQHPLADHIRWYLTQQSDWFNRYWENLTIGNSKLALVDTGWQGTMQRMLTHAYPDKEFIGIYFGKSGFASTNREFWGDMVGLMFEEDEFAIKNLLSSITAHRHLIEAIFEPNGASIESISLDQNSEPHFPGATALLNERPTFEKDPLYIGIRDYIRTSSQLGDLTSLNRQCRKASRVLTSALLFPVRAEAEAIGSMHRSADFGRHTFVPVLLPPVARSSGDSIENRIKDSLWPAGQAALEYSEEIASHRQKLEVPGIRGRQALLEAISGADAESGLQSSGSVAIITRTVDRPIFLRRALESVSGQTYKNYKHVVVCDGGDMVRVRDEIQRSCVDPTKLILIHNPISRGMEAASNIGINSVDSDYVVIHDDDDSWEPRFLEKTVEYLEAATGKKYGGVVAGTNYVSEEIGATSIVERSKTGYMDWVTNISLLEMASQNMFAPIAFVFRRSVLEKIGNYDESFAVLGDWDFNLRFLLESDIGVIKEKLANYHHRDSGNSRVFGNSVIAAIDKHAEYHSVMRNKHLRDTPLGRSLAAVTAVGMVNSEMRQRDKEGLREILMEIRNLEKSAGQRLPVVAWEVLKRMSIQLEDRWNAIAYLIDKLASPEGAQAKLSQRGNSESEHA